MNRTRSTARPVAVTELMRAFRRALAEHLFAYPRPDGRWTCKHYTIDVTGPQPTDVDCDCADAVSAALAESGATARVTTAAKVVVTFIVPNSSDV